MYMGARTHSVIAAYSMFVQRWGYSITIGRNSEKIFLEMKKLYIKNTKSDYDLTNFGIGFQFLEESRTN